VYIVDWVAVVENDVGYNWVMGDKAAKAFQRCRRCRCGGRQIGVINHISERSFIALIAVRLTFISVSKSLRAS